LFIVDVKWNVIMYTHTRTHTHTQESTHTHEAAWSVGELVQASVILTTFQSYAGFVYGMGVLPDVDVMQMPCVNTEFSELFNAKGSRSSSSTSSRSSSFSSASITHTANSDTRTSSSSSFSSPSHASANASSSSHTTPNTTPSASSRTPGKRSESEAANMMKLMRSNINSVVEQHSCDTHNAFESIQTSGDAVPSSDDTKMTPGSVAAVWAHYEASSKNAPCCADATSRNPRQQFAYTPLEGRDHRYTRQVDRAQGNSSNAKTDRAVNNLRFENFKLDSKEYRCAVRVCVWCVCVPWRM
jgi:hypothetical protein